MVDEKKLGETIEKIYPPIGKQNEDFDVHYDENAQAIAIDLHDEKFHLQTYVEEEEAAACVDENNCIALGIELGQLRRNFAKYKEEHALEGVH